VFRKDGVDHLRNNRIPVADDAGKELFSALDAADQILPEFVLHAAVRVARFGEVAGAERTQCLGQMGTG